MRIQESLYLNAFLLVELIRMALRVLLVLAFLAAAYVVSTLWVGIIFGTVIAFTVQPLYRRMARGTRMKKEFAAVTLTAVVGLVTAAIGAVVIYVMTRELFALVAVLQKKMAKGSLAEFIGNPAVRVLEKAHVDQALVVDKIKEAEKTLSSYPQIRCSEDLRQAIASWIERRYSLKSKMDLREVHPINGSREGLFFAAMPFARDWWALACAIAFMVAAFGQIPINDYMIGKMARSELRASIYGVRYFVSFVALAATMVLIAWVHKNWGFDALFRILAGAAAAIFCAVTLLPSRLPEPGPLPQRA